MFSYPEDCCSDEWFQSLKSFILCIEPSWFQDIGGVAPKEIERLQNHLNQCSDTKFALPQEYRAFLQHMGGTSISHFTYRPMAFSYYSFIQWFSIQTFGMVLI